MDISFEDMISEELGSSPSNFLEITVLELQDQQEVDASSVVSISGQCNSGSDVEISGDFLSSSFLVSCVSNSYNAILNVRNSIANDTALELTQIIEDQTVQTTLILDVVNFCGGASIKACAVSGAGSTENPYQIDSIECLQEMRDGMTCSYELVSDIDASATSSWNAGAGWIPVGRFGLAFQGDLNGNGYKISNLFISYTGGDFVEVGLFGATNGSEVSNLELEQVDIFGDSTGLRGVAGFIGWAENTLLTNVSVSGEISGEDHIASIVARPSNLTIENSYSTANLTGTSGASRVGGLVGGFGGSVTIANSYYAGTIDTSSTYLVGGLVAQFENGSQIVNSFMAGQMLQTTGRSGALVGSAGATSEILNSYWYSGGVMPASAVGDGTPNINDSHSMNSINYFYSSSNEPLSNWDFTTDWLDRNLSGEFPSLR